jgi:hypothetical protein
MFFYQKEKKHEKNINYNNASHGFDISNFL